jgi:hypothetical protein
MPARLEYEQEQLRCVTRIPPITSSSSQALLKKTAGFELDAHLNASILARQSRRTVIPFS